MAEPRFDEAIHPHNRLQICAILAEVEAIDFATIRETLSISDSSLSKHIKYLADAGYVAIDKKRDAGHTRTWARFTPAGREAYEGHLAELRRIVNAVG